MSAPLPLRALSAGDLLDEAVSLYRKNFLRFTLIVAVLRLPLMLVTSAMQSARDTQPFAFTALNIFGIAANHFLIATILSAVFARVVADHLSGTTHSLLNLYRGTARRFLALLLSVVAANVAYGIVLAGSWFAFTAIMYAILEPVGLMRSIGLLSNLFTLSTAVLLAAMLGLPLLYLVARWSVALQVIVLERRGPREALQRSVTLMHGQYRRVMWFLLGLFLLGSVLSTAPSFASQMLAESIVPTYRHELWTEIAYLLFTVAIPTMFDLIFLPISFIARALLYYDLRVRAEGYDLAVRVAHWVEQPT